MLYRWAAGKKERLVDLANELLQLKVDVFASGSTEAIVAIRSVDSAIPIVMMSISDPIGSGLVTSCAPGGKHNGPDPLLQRFGREAAGAPQGVYPASSPRDHSR